MSKNIIMSELTSEGYQELYPKTLGSQIEGTVAEASHSLTADKANIANLNWITLFENSYFISNLSENSTTTFTIAENSFSAEQLIKSSLVSIEFLIPRIPLQSTIYTSAITLSIPFVNQQSRLSVRNKSFFPAFCVGYYGKLRTLQALRQGGGIDYYNLNFTDMLSNSTSAPAHMNVNPITFVNQEAIRTVRSYDYTELSSFYITMKIKYISD